MFSFSSAFCYLKQISVSALFVLSSYRVFTTVFPSFVVNPLNTVQKKKKKKKKIDVQRSAVLDLLSYMSCAQVKVRNIP